MQLIYPEWTCKKCMQKIIQSLLLILFQYQGPNLAAERYDLMHSIIKIPALNKQWKPVHIIISDFCNVALRFGNIYPKNIVKLPLQWYTVTNQCGLRGSYCRQVTLHFSLNLISFELILDAFGRWQHVSIMSEKPQEKYFLDADLLYRSYKRSGMYRRCWPLRVTKELAANVLKQDNA